MAQDIDKLIPDGAKQDLEDVSKLWDDIVTKVTGYVKEVQKISVSPDASRTLISMDESLAKIAESTRRYEKALQDMAAAQQRAAESARQLAKANTDVAKGTASEQKGILFYIKNVGELSKGIGDLYSSKKRLLQQGQSVGSMFKNIGGFLIGWQAAIQVGIALVSALADEWADFTRKSNVDNAVRERALQLHTEERVKLEVLRAEVNNNATSQGRLREIRTELLQMSPELHSSLKGETDLRAKLTEAIDKNSEALELNATINAAFELISEEKKKQIQGDLSFWEHIKVGFKGLGHPAGIMVAAMEERIENDAESEKYIDGLLKKIVDTRKELEKLGIKGKGKGGDGKGSGITPDANARQNIELSINDRIEKAKAMQHKTYADDIAHDTARIAGDEKQSLDARIKAHTEFVNMKLKINDGARDLELHKILENLKQISEIEKIPANQRTEEQNRLLMEKEAFLAEQIAIESKYKYDEIRIIKDGEDAKLNIFKQAAEQQQSARLKYVEELEKYNQRLAQDEINALTQKYGKGLMSEEKYQEGLNEIKTRYASLSLGRAIEFLQEELNTAQLSANEKIAIEQRLADLRVKSEEMANEKILKSRQKMAKVMKDVSKALEEAAVAMYKGIMDSNIKNIEEAQKAADRKKEEDIANVEASVGSEEDKQARIAGINAAYEARKTALENQKRQQERKKAEFERALAISKAIYEGSSAVVEALPNIPLSVSVGLIAAANIAKMLATPLPGYYKGTDNAAPGLAWVGERGTEVIVSRDGSLSLTPDRPTLAYMQGGEQVIPNHMLDSFLVPQLYGQDLKPQANGFNTQKLERKLDAVERAIRNKPVANFHVADGAIRKSIIAGNSKYHYIKKHII